MTKLAPDGTAPHLRHSSIAAISLFFLLTFFSTWGLWWASLSIKPHAPGLSGAIFLASAFCPGLAAVVVLLACDGTTGLHRWMTQCLRWRIGWRWYALAGLIPPLIMLAAVTIDVALGGTMPAVPDSSHLLIAMAQFPLIAAFGGPLGEEFGWRGYALPALGARIGWRRAGLVIGAAWALWHVPLFFMAGTAQADLPLAWFLASTVGLSVVMARLSVNTGFSVLPAILLHSVINWWSMVVPIMPSGGNGRAYALVSGMAVIVALVALIKPGPRTGAAPEAVRAERS